MVTFTFHDAQARSVAVAGDFSGWEQRSLQRGSDDRWTLSTVLPPGVYHYSFVIDGETWKLPSNATGIVDDGFGRRNATIVVTEKDTQ
jgi:1,4-alpha-glucan branching enzyme